MQRVSCWKKNWRVVNSCRRSNKSKRVSVFASPSTWTLATNRGDATLVLKGEEDIRRIGESALIIADTHGIQFLIRDLNKLDKASRKLLDRFL